MNKQISVVIPVYNEEEVLESLFQRLFPAMDKLKSTYEIIFINDGSKDKSLEILTNCIQNTQTRQWLLILIKIMDNIWP